MTKINFNEQDFFDAEKKNKADKNKKKNSIVEKVNTNWNKIFGDAKIDENKSVDTVSEEKPILNNKINTTLDKNLTNQDIANKKEIDKDTLLSEDNNINISKKLNSKDNIKPLNAIATSNKIDIDDKKEDSSYQKLQDKIKEIEKKFDIFPKKNEELTNNLELKKKEYINKSDEEIKKNAENSLDEYKREKLHNIENKFDNAIKNFDGKEDKLKESAKDEKAKISAYFENAKENAENQALKRGLQRSSIIINNLNAFDNDKIASLMAIDKNLNKEIDEIGDSIAKLNQERQNAMDNFDMEYAIKINNEINAFKDEIQDKNDEITEYNNKIAEIEANFANDIKKDNQKLDNYYMENVIDYGKNKGIIDNMREYEFGQVVDEYLNSLSKAQAIKELETNAEFKKLLGNNYSYFLYKTKNR